MICAILINLIARFGRDEHGGHALEFAFMIMLISAVLLPIARMSGAALAGAVAAFMP